ARKRHEQKPKRAVQAQSPQHPLHFSSLLCHSVCDKGTGGSGEPPPQSRLQPFRKLQKLFSELPPSIAFPFPFSSIFYPLIQTAKTLSEKTGRQFSPTGPPPRGGPPV